MRGFTLVEALIAVVITFLIAIAIAGMVTTFVAHIPHRLLLTCLTEAAKSGIEACEAGVVINSVSCGGYNITVNIQGDCNPPPNTCSDIVSTAIFDSLSVSFSGKVCNFP